MSDGSIRNTYDIRMLNKNGEPRQFRLSVVGDPSLRIQLEGSLYDSIEVPADTGFLQRVYVVSPGASAPSNAGNTDIRFWVEDLSNGDRAYKDSTFNGKGN